MSKPDSPFLDYPALVSAPLVIEEIRMTINAYRRHVADFDEDRMMIVMNEWVYLVVSRSVGDPLDTKTRICLKICGIKALPCLNMTDKAFELMEVQEQ